VIPMNGLQQTLKSESQVGVKLGKADGKSAFSTPGVDSLFEHALKEKIKPELDQDPGLEGALIAATTLQQGFGAPEIKPEPKALGEGIQGQKAREASGSLSARKSALDSRALVESEALKKGVVDSDLDPNLSLVDVNQVMMEAGLEQQQAPGARTRVINPEQFENRGDQPLSAVSLVDPRVSELLSNSELKVQDFELKEASNAKTEHATKSVSQPEKSQQQSLPSRVSTEDFMSLRGIREKKSTKSEPQLKAEQAGPLNLSNGKIHLGPTLEAPVTHGTAGKTILSHDALNQITNQVNLMSKAKQDGEIKIRLKPDHLGELMMSVKTDGQQVSLQIKAQDHESKRIIEESLGRLKDSLATQSLDLGKVDVVTQSAQSQGSDFGLQMDLGQQGRGFQQGSSGQETASFGGGRQEFLYDENPVSGNLKTINVAARSGRASGPGSLDLIA